MTEEFDYTEEEDDDHFPTLAEIEGKTSNENDNTVPSTNTPNSGEENKQGEQNSSFSNILAQEFGWEGVPDNIEPIEAFKIVTQQYEVVIEDLKKELEQVKNNTIPDELIKYEESFNQFKSLSPKEAIIKDLIENDYLTQEEAEEEANELELEGKLQRRYNKLQRATEKKYQEGLEGVKQEVQRRQQLAEQESQLAYQKEIVEFTSTLNEFKSEYVDVTPEDKKFLKEAFLTTDQEGLSLVDRMIGDKKTVIEMTMAYFKMQDLKNLPDKLKKQIANEMVNRMSSEPIFNSKQKENFDPVADYWDNHDED